MDPRDIDDDSPARLLLSLSHFSHGPRKNGRLRAYFCRRAKRGSGNAVNLGAPDTTHVLPQEGSVPRPRRMTHTVMHFRSERRKGAKKAHEGGARRKGERGREREREKEARRKKRFGVRTAKNRCILCSDPSIAVPFVQCGTVRPNGRSSYESTRERALSGELFIAFFFFFQRVSFCASCRVRVFGTALSRSLAYSITGVSYYGIGRVQRSFASRTTASPDLRATTASSSMC